jgi:hypothetical protein
MAMRAYKDTEKNQHKIHMKLRIIQKISHVSKYIEYQKGTQDYGILWCDGIFFCTAAEYCVIIPK